ncbi:MAG: hypothetical protein ACOCWA_05075 [Bacteroidota bacterium]
MKLKKNAILYVEGILDKEKIRKFEKEITKRPDIREFIKTYRWLDANLKIYFSQVEKESEFENGYQRNDEIKNDIHKYLVNYEKKDNDPESRFLEILNNCYHPGRQKFRANYNLLLNIAASGFFIFMIISAILNFSGTSFNQKNGNQIFNDNFSPAEDPNIENLNSSYVTIYNVDKNNVNPSKRGFQISESTTIMREGSVNSEDILLISLALMEKEEFGMAEIYLRDLLNDPDVNIKNSARWYLALTEIKTGQYEKAFHNFNFLCEKKNSYMKPSCTILKTLKEKNID